VLHSIGFAVYAFSPQLGVSGCQPQRCSIQNCGAQEWSIGLKVTGSRPAWLMKQFITPSKGLKNEPANEALGWPMCHNLHCLIATPSSFWCFSIWWHIWEESSCGGQNSSRPMNTTTVSSSLILWPSCGEHNGRTNNVGPEEVASIFNPNDVENNIWYSFLKYFIICLNVTRVFRIRLWEYTIVWI
jgi:hypothetical protein